MPQLIHPKVLSWASILDDNTSQQAKTLSELPFIHQHVALMADAHLGKGATVGSVIATNGAIVPAAVGVDLGCGMLAVETSFAMGDIGRPVLEYALEYLSNHVPAGVGQGHDETTDLKKDSLTILTDIHAGRSREGDGRRLHRDLDMGKPYFDIALNQLGTLGSGNHFLEYHYDENDSIWAVVHSGSRGVGNKLAVQHIKHAQKLMGKWFIDLPDSDLAYIPTGTLEFGHYLADVAWAQDYAWLNRQWMMFEALKAINDLETIERRFHSDSWFSAASQSDHHVHCHHNYMAQENHMGANLWVTRKGAVRAQTGDLSVLPGSMGTKSYIMRGLGHPGSFNSAPHGAGRRLSRTAAKKNLDIGKMRTMMADRVWLEDDAEALLDEHPDAYKDIDTVLEDSKDLIEVVHELTPILNYKGVK